jgi:hypothetical protein
MKNITFPLRMPEELRDEAMRLASKSGVSANLFFATAIAARVGAQAETERYFSARARRTTAKEAKAILARLGTPTLTREDDRLEAE